MSSLPLVTSALLHTEDKLCANPGQRIPNAAMVVSHTPSHGDDVKATTLGGSRTTQEQPVVLSSVSVGGYSQCTP